MALIPNHKLKKLNKLKLCFRKYYSLIILLVYSESSGGYNTFDSTRVTVIEKKKRKHIKIILLKAQNFSCFIF